MEFIFNKIILGSIKTVSKQYLNIDICIINSKFGLPLSQTREKKERKRKEKEKVPQDSAFPNGLKEKTDKRSQNDGIFIKFVITYRATLPLLLFWSEIVDTSMLFCS